MRDRKGSFLPPGRWPREALAQVSTHDLPTLAGFWAGHDIETKRALSLFPPDVVALPSSKDVAGWTIPAYSTTVETAKEHVAVVGMTKKRIFVEVKVLDVRQKTSDLHTKLLAAMKHRKTASTDQYSRGPESAFPATTAIVVAIITAVLSVGATLATQVLKARAERAAKAAEAEQLVARYRDPLLRVSANRSFPRSGRR